MPAVITLPDGTEVDCSPYAGGWPLDCWRGQPVAMGRRPALLYALHRGWWRDLEPMLRERVAFSDAVGDLLPGVQVLEVAGGNALVLVLGLAEAQPALAFPPVQGEESLPTLVEECRTLADALERLHGAGLVWLNFDPECLVRSGGRVQITNLDLQLFRAGSLPANLIPPLRYSPPEVVFDQGDAIGPATDVFHLSAYLYYRLAGLSPDGFPGEGLYSFDFRIPPLRVYCPWLPIGIASVLECGLARDPETRYSTVADLLAALEEACARAQQRRDGREFTWEMGGLTVTGPTKALRGQVNQDAMAMLTLEQGGRPFPVAVVADGVSICGIGSGEEASQTACAVLAQRLPPSLEAARTEEELAESLTTCCLEASEAILARALTKGPLTKGPLPTAFDPGEVMGSTALIGVVRPEGLTLANVGDSRAYLIAPRQGGWHEGWSVDQLTVDGDVYSVELAAGLPPEEVLQLGPDGLALYSCLGVCVLDDAGRPVPCPERSAPFVSHWALVPGDVIVLCTDGLVEDGVFLDPSDLGVLVAAHPELSAQALAQVLVGHAEARQQPPSERCPDGVGDNVTCVVIRIKEPEPES